LIIIVVELKLFLVEISLAIFIYLVYDKNPQRYADLIKEKLLDLLEQAFPNPMLVNDLAK
jgi:hypothetical protein